MEKTFDCLKMKETLQAKVYEKIKDMTSSELCAYLDKSMENNEFWQKLVKRDNEKMSEPRYFGTSAALSTALRSV
jgi:ribonuclease HIII